MSKRTAAIDGDMIIYKAGFASEVETRWSDAIWTLHSSEDQMKLIENLIEDNVRKPTSELNQKLSNIKLRRENLNLSEKND